MLCSPAVHRFANRLPRRLLLAWGVALFACQTASAAWHADLDAARAAAASSGRPVLAVVTASWDSREGGAAERVLTSPEAEAVVAACFEAVRLDADADADAVRSLGVAHVPSGCVMGVDGSVVTIFDMPLTTVDFVASIARLAQQVATPASPTGAPAAAGAAAETMVEHRAAEPPATESHDAVSVFESRSPFAGTGLVREVDSGRGAISLVTAKLRRLSDFATDEPSGTRPPSIADHPPTVRSPDTIDGMASIASAEEPSPADAAPLNDAPQLVETPPGWPAERVGPLTTTTPAIGQRPEIAPAGAPVAATIAPWRSEPAAPSADPWGRPLPTQPVLPAPAREPSLALPSPAERDFNTAQPLASSPTPQQTAAPLTGLTAAAPAAPAASAPVAGFAAAPAFEPQPPAQAQAQVAAQPQFPAQPQPAPQAQPATQPQPSVAAAPLPETSAAETPPETPAQGGFMAALQKPFAPLWRKEPAAAEPPTLPPARTQRAADLMAGATAPSAPATPADTAATDSHGTMPLGLEGYCPVTLVDTGAWAEGRVQWGARHRGRTYLFVGAEQQAAFLANPDRYAPALSGDDPVLALESGVSTPGQRRYGVTYEARMYLFSSPETRAAFAADPARYTRAVLVAERGPSVAADTRRY